MAVKEIQGNNLVYKTGFLFWKKNYQLDLNEIVFIVPRKGWIQSHYVFIGDKNGFHYKLRVNKALTSKILKKTNELGAPVMENLNNIIEFDNAAQLLLENTEDSIKKNNFKKNSLWLTSDTVIFVPKRKILQKDDVPVYIPIEDVRFTTTYPHKILFGTLQKGHETYFGSPSEQATFVHPKTEHSERLVNHLKENGSKIGMSNDKEFKDAFWLGKLLKPWLFFRHETIGFNKEGITYTFKKGKKTENVFLFYDEIKYADLKKGLTHSNNIKIIGKQNIFTKLQFSNKAIELIKAELSTKNIKQASLLLIPRMMLGLLKNPLAKRSFALLDDSVCYTDKKTKDVVVFDFNEVTNICWKKKHWYYFVGYMFVEGQAENFRKDQANMSYSKFVVPKIWFTKKNIVKNTVDATYNDKDFKKGCDIEDVKYS